MEIQDCNYNRNCDIQQNDYVHNIFSMANGKAEKHVR